MTTTLPLITLPLTAEQIQARLQTQQLIELKDVSWKVYQDLMVQLGSDRACRIAYDRGVLELRMPLQEHEQPKIIIADLITALADDLEIEILQLGALKLEREDLTRAVEPDTCFYVQNELRVRGIRNITLPEDPPPDLVVESDYTSSSLDKFSLYAAIGAPELWRYHKKVLEVYLLRDGVYQRSQQSSAFPLFPIAEVPNLIEQSYAIGQRAVVRQFRKLIQTMDSSNLDCIN